MAELWHGTEGDREFSTGQIVFYALSGSAEQIAARLDRIRSRHEGLLIEGTATIRVMPPAEPPPCIQCGTPMAAHDGMAWCPPLTKRRPHPCKIWHDDFGACELPYRHAGPHSRIPGGATEANKWWLSPADIGGCLPA